MHSNKRKPDTMTAATLRRQVAHNLERAALAQPDRLRSLSDGRAHVRPHWSGGPIEGDPNDRRWPGV